MSERRLGLGFKPDPLRQTWSGTSEPCQDGHSRCRPVRRLFLATTPFIIIFTFTFARQTGLAQGLKSDYDSQELKIRREKQAFKERMEARAIEISQTQFADSGLRISKSLSEVRAIMNGYSRVNLFKVEGKNLYIYDLIRAFKLGNTTSGWRKEADLGVKVSSGAGEDYYSFQYEIESNMLCKYSQSSKYSRASNSYVPGSIDKSCIGRADPKTIETIQSLFVRYGND